MNFSVILYGNCQLHHRTVVSLSDFDHLTIVPCHTLADINFQALTSQYTFFIKSGDTLSDYGRQCLEFNTSRREADIFYSDESWLCTQSLEKLHFYKPDYSPEMILSMPYFGNLLCIKTGLLQNIKKIDSVCYQNFLYELILKLLPLHPVIAHIDEALYLNYRDKKAVRYQDCYAEFDQAAGRQLLENYCHQNQIQARVVDGQYHATYRLQYAIEGEPLISIIIPFKDKPELLQACVSSILKKSSYKNFEIIGINNHSVEDVTLQLMLALKQQDARIQFHDFALPFNYSALNNYAVQHFAQGEHIVFLNNDTEVIAPGWIEAMLEHSQRPAAGVVGAKLLYPDHTLQHCGVILGHLVLHAHRQLPDNHTGYFYFPHIVRNYHAVTFACAMIKTALFNQCEGLNEMLKVACNDVDLCARVSALGYYNVYTPYAILYHYESKSRGLDNTPERMKRALWERELAAEVTPALFLKDTFYNKNLTQYDDDFSEGVHENIKGFFLLFIKRVRRRYRELGLINMVKLAVERFKNK